MKKAIAITIVILLCIQANAQTLSGVVYDKATKQPVQGAYVYLNGTSIVNLTDNSGKFSLTVRQTINTQLVFSHITYNLVNIEDPFNNLPDTIYMEERPNTLREVIVHGDPFSRQQKLRAFREQFLGITQAGRSCRIVNEDDIQVWYNVPTKTLFASSNQPIEVINEYLGYRTLFTLVDFKTEYSSVTLNRNRVQQSYYAVLTSFTDLKPDDIRIKKRRDDVYVTSTRNFFKCLAYDPFFILDTTDDPIFWVYEGRNQIDFNSHFIINDTISQKAIKISNALIEKENPDDSLLRINISHYDSDNRGFRYYSRISFFTNTLLVDQYGNIDKIDKVTFEGRLGRARAGNMLPLNYVP